MINNPSIHNTKLILNTPESKLLAKIVWNGPNWSLYKIKNIQKRCGAKLIQPKTIKNSHLVVLALAWPHVVPKDQTGQQTWHRWKRHIKHIEHDRQKKHYSQIKRWHGSANVNSLESIFRVKTSKVATLTWQRSGLRIMPNLLGFTFNAGISTCFSNLW